MFIRTFFYKKCKNISIRQHYGSNNKLTQMNNMPEIIPTIDSESKFKGYEQEKEYINAYCDITDIIIDMEGK